MPATLGDLEQLVLLALMRLGDRAYGVSVRDAISERSRRDLACATVYTTLARLETKGLVNSFAGEPTPERGGRAKKHFRVTPAGRDALKQSLGDIRAMTHDLGAAWRST